MQCVSYFVVNKQNAFARLKKGDRKIRERARDKRLPMIISALNIFVISLEHQDKTKQSEKKYVGQKVLLVICQKVECLS